MPNAKSKGPVGTVFGWFFTVCAALFMPFWELGKFLTKKTYSGSFIRGLFVSLSGAPATIYAGFFAANIVGWHYNFSFPVWITAGAIGAALTGGIVWPALYLGLFKPLWDLGDKAFKVNRKLAENVVQPLASGLLGLARVLPGSDKLWQVSEGKDTAGRKWGLKFLGAVLFLGSLGVGLTALYFTYSALVGILPVFVPLPLFTGLYLSQVVAATIGLTAMVMATGFLCQWVEYGHDKEDRQSVTAVVYSAAAAYFAVTKLAVLAALSPVAGGFAAAGIFVVALAYGLPVLLTILQGGLVDRLLKGWKYILEAAYDAEEDKVYALFFAQVANIALAFLEGLVAYLVADAVHLPQALVYAVTALVAVYAYASNPRELTSSRAVTPVFGLMLSAAAGFAAYHYAPQAVLAHAHFFQYAFGVVAAFVVGLVAYPLGYLALRVVARPVAPSLGPVLLSGSTRVTAVYKKMADRLRKLQRAAYDDSTAFSGMFGHLFIIGLVTATCWNGLAGAYWATLGAVGMAFWLNVLVTAIAAVNVYMLLAKLSSRFSAETFGLTTAAAAFLAAGHWALGMTAGNYYAAAVVGVTVAGIVGGVVAPAVYLVLRVPANVILTPWLAPVLKAVFESLWALYVAFWNRFAIVLRLVTAFFGPLVALFAAVWRGMREAYARILGRK